LACLIVVAILAGALVPAWRGALAGASPEKEAQSLARWFSSLTTRSNRSGRTFRLICPGTPKQNFIEAEWENPLEKEKYTSLYDYGFNRYQSNNTDSFYSPQWNSLIPTATIKVSRGQAECFVVISQHARARISPSPPK
jgi:type II secretory pathway pseudopilin PulG